MAEIVNAGCKGKGGVGVLEEIQDDAARPHEAAVSAEVAAGRGVIYPGQFVVSIDPFNVKKVPEPPPGSGEVIVPVQVGGRGGSSKVLQPPPA
ncbi:MAG: hypothetical protein WB562_11640 [Candidatus Sulfotelmatobacter sp.]